MGVGVGYYIMADGKYGSTTLHSHNSWGNRGGGGKKDRDKSRQSGRIPSFFLSFFLALIRVCTVQF